MIIDLKQGPEGRVLFATIRPRNRLTQEIELRITPHTKDRQANQSLIQIVRMLEHLRFCEAGSCDCAECIRHQVRAIMSYCRLASCDVSANILHRDQDTAIKHQALAGVSKSRKDSSARTGAAEKLL